MPASRRVPPSVAADWRPETLLRWRERHRPGVVVSLKTTVDWLLGAGLRIPGDCGFAMLNIEAPRFAGVDEQRHDVGAAAIDLIVEQLQAHRLGLPAKPKIVLTECRWVDGPTAPAPGRAPAAQQA